MTHDTHENLWRDSIDHPEQFWLRAAELIDWSQPPTRALSDAEPPFQRWFPDGRLNTCFNAVDRHVAAGHGDRLAIVHESPVSSATTSITYAELLESVTACAGAMAEQGVGYGDRVLIYMPMIPEAAVAMLACARLGAIHSVVFGGFAARELAARIEDAHPSLIVSASCGLEPDRTIDYKPLLDEALELAGAPEVPCVVVQRPISPAPLRAGRDIAWDDFLESGQLVPAACVDVASTDALYILYTSGTTAKPKGVVRDNGGHAVAMTWSINNIFDIRAGDVMWAASDIGWVVGHSYIVYAPLIAGATTILYEGKPVGTPDAGQFWRLVERHGVNAFFTAPTAMRAVRRVDPEGRFVGDHDLSSLRNVFLAGERLDPATQEWLTSLLGLPVVDNWWQTETGWPIAANLRGLAPSPIKVGSPSLRVPGFDVRILDPSGVELPAGEEGDICLKLPLPPGSLLTVWGDDDRFLSSYMSAHEGFYATGDGGRLDEDGYLYVMGRTDDVINVAGHRLSTGAIEGVLSRHPWVTETAVVGVEDSLKGQLPRGFVIVKDAPDVDLDILRDELVQLVREQIGAVVSFRDVEFVRALPKTRSGKILRGVLRDLVDRREVRPPSTIEDPAVIDQIRSELSNAR